MFVTFESLPDYARLWVYQSPRILSSSEQDIISHELKTFTEQWQVHGQPMKASFKIYYDMFLILAADEGYNAASGCSIDGSVRLLKSLGAEMDIDFLDRSTVAFKNNEAVIFIKVPELKQKVEAGLWSKDTLTFNNAISTKADIRSNWILPAHSTWLKRYLPRESVNL